MPVTETVKAAFGSSLNAPDSGNFVSIVYLPEGTHEISATVNGKPQVRKVTVDERVLASFKADLSKRLTDNVRPFAGFDHQAGPASLIPLDFRYETGVGLILDAELTQAGRVAIEGRNYSYWSPTHLLRNGVPVGLNASGEIGSFTNDPAYRDIERIAASHTETTMEITETLVELGLAEAGQSPEEAVSAAQAALATLRENASTVETVTASNAEIAEKIEAANAEVARLTGELESVRAANAALVERENKAKDKELEDLVQAAVNRGAIPPKDDKTKAFWLESLKANTELAQAALAALPSAQAASGESEAVKAAAAKPATPDPISRSEFDKLSKPQQNAFMRSGGKIS
jgi:hypothetical protein